MELTQYENERSVSRCTAKRSGTLSYPERWGDAILRNKSSPLQHLLSGPLCRCVDTERTSLGNTSAPTTPASVMATPPEVPEIPEKEEVISPEKEKAETTMLELVEEADIAPEPSPTPTSPKSEAQASPEQDATPQQKPEPASVSHKSTSDNMVYVPGFGWIEIQGPNHVEYTEDIYEDGNRIIIMEQIGKAVPKHSLPPQEQILSYIGRFINCAYETLDKAVVFYYILRKTCFILTGVKTMFSFLLPNYRILRNYF